MAYKDLTALVVDDFSTMRRIVKNILRDLEFKNILEAEDGMAAVSVLKAQKVDVIVSDWNMPKMTGLDLLKFVRSDDTLKNLPFLMITAESQKENVVEAVKAKVSNYIVKPFTAETLGEKLAKILPD
ncbi:response regulator [Desulfoferrobacter suflitae]|uniref:response regulator n=1 Tax=Desulfoferrobacter suflitae TaxID=2865782 RepID=UPI00216414C1|nr:response regulator [Desulfoferrobacter suflitae]MCK8602401.1 response regulator [Desulfoferrobacter suflitae]